VDFCERVIVAEKSSHYDLVSQEKITPPKAASFNQWAMQH
jgi:hypothetical protein